MKIFRVLSHRELFQALSHVHYLAYVHFVEKAGDEIGQSYQEPLLCSVNRVLDFLEKKDPEGECWIDREHGAQPVIAALMGPDGVRLVLDRDRARPAGVSA
jgi:hypothetical protein